MLSEQSPAAKTSGREVRPSLSIRMPPGPASTPIAFNAPPCRLQQRAVAGGQENGLLRQFFQPDGSAAVERDAQRFAALCQQVAAVKARQDLRLLLI